MKIGFISTQFPADLKTSVYGGFKRMGMFIEALKELGELDALFYVRPEMQLHTDIVNRWQERLADHFKAKLKLDLCRLSPIKPPMGRWQEYVRPALSIANLPPYLQTAQDEQIDAARRLLSRNPDILFVHRLSSMVPILLTKMPLPQTYFDLDEIEHVSFLRSIRQPPMWTGKPLLYLRLPVMRRWENRAIRASHATFVCSEQDRQYLTRKCGHDRVVVIPNAVDLPRVKALPDTKNLLFLGFLSFHPNTIAADHLIEDIWPTVLSSLPDARLLIAGARPEWLASYKKEPKGVTFVGFVDDLERLYDEVAVVCCPILYGSGTRIKILEAAAHGKPVVSTTIGAEGIDLKDGEEILLRDDPKSFAEACIRLLTDKSLAARMAHKARSAIERSHERRAVVGNIKRVISNAVASDRGPDTPSASTARLLDVQVMSMADRQVEGALKSVSASDVQDQEGKLSFLLTIALSDTGRDNQDLERARLLIRSFTKYFDRSKLSKFFIVTTARDKAVVGDAVGPMFAARELEILNENEVCPEFEHDPDTTGQWPRPNKGWYRQQLIKLAIHERIDTPFYMTLDSDVLFVKPFTTDSLIRGGKAPLNVQTEADFKRLYRKKRADHEVEVRLSRYRRAEYILKCERKPEYAHQWYGETPVLLSCRIAKALTGHIEAVWMKPWRQALIDNLPWTEYPLYFLFAEEQGLLEQNYVCGTADSVLRLSRSLWQPADQYVVHRDLSNWNPVSIFDSDDEGIAVVVQSYLGYPVPEIKKRIDRFLGQSGN